MRPQGVCMCVVCLHYWVFSLLVYPHRRWNICHAADKYGQSMGDVCTHKYLLSVCECVCVWATLIAMVRWIFPIIYFFLTVFSYCFKKRRGNVNAELGGILNRKLDSGEKLDKIQLPQDPWSLEVPTVWHYTHLCTGKKKYLIHQRELPTMHLDRHLLTVAHTNIYSLGHICTEVRGEGWTQSCWSLWDFLILHVPFSSKMDGGGDAVRYGGKSGENMVTGNILVITLQSSVPSETVRNLS